MDKRFFTLFVLTNDASKARQLRIPVKLFKAAGAAAVFLSIILAYVLFDYARLKMMDVELASLQKENTSQKLELQGFAAKIKDLEAHLAKLNLFDKKLRIIANIDEPKPTGGNPDHQILGMGGGSSTEDYFSTPGAKVDVLVKQMKKDITELETRAGSQENSFTELHEQLMRQSSLLASTPSIWPSRGWVTSNYGERTSPFTGFQHLHKGIDIANRVGTPVLATAEGIVVQAGSDPGGLGKSVRIAHGYGMKTTYGHLSEVLVRTGQRVKRGTKIATMGNTGRSTGPHLHYEVTQNGVSLNPNKYILD